MSVKVRFQVRTPPQARTAELLGDFTNWQEKPIPMRKVRDGLFEAHVRLEEPNRYQYKFRIDDQWKEVLDDGAPATGTVPTPFGSRNYYIDVRAGKGTRPPLEPDGKAARRRSPRERCGYNLNCEALEILKKCGTSGEMAEWNRWRQENPCEIFLEGANLSGARLKFVDLSRVHLSHASLQKADLQGADLRCSWLLNANMEGCHLYRANLDDADIQGARLQGANMIEASLMGTNARYTFLQRANLHHAALQGANFSYAIVDGETLLDTDRVDRNTDFTSVGLSSARLRPGLIDSLSYNIRRNRWHDWYEQGNGIVRLTKKLMVQPFWWISDYGRSTGRILAIFLALALIFTAIYTLNPDAISGLEKQLGVTKIYRTIYFSVVTMVTLGFGNMNAHPNSLLGNTTVMVQILSGYLILAALVTRISVLFSSGGPALRLHKTR